MRSLIHKKKGENILTENVIFIVLNLAFISILLIFLFAKTNSAATLQEKYAKEIALALDSARPGMTINISMADAVNAAGKNGLDTKKIVDIKGNIVTVDLTGKEGYTYSFFNDINFDGVKNRYYMDNQNLTIKLLR